MPAFQILMVCGDDKNMAINNPFLKIYSQMLSRPFMQTL